MKPKFRIGDIVLTDFDDRKYTIKKVHELLFKKGYGYYIISIDGKHAMISHEVSLLPYNIIRMLKESYG